MVGTHSMRKKLADIEKSLSGLGIETRKLQNLIKQSKEEEESERETEKKSIADDAVGLLSKLRAASQTALSFHWSSEKYDQHLLFQRIYTDIDQDIDQLAEKITSDFGKSCLCPIDILKQSAIFASSMNIDLGKEHRGQMLEVEKSLIQEIANFHKSLESNDKLSLGWDDFLSSLSSDHEDIIYLLKIDQ